MSTPTKQSNPTYPICACKRTVKKGKRRNRLQVLQVFQCAECLHRFTGEAGENRTYPLKIILESISTFNLGYSLTETQGLLRKRFHRDIPARTISSWLTEFRPLTPYARMRAEGRKLFAPGAVVHTINFHHQQVYRHQMHRAKRQIILEFPAHRRFGPLTAYLASLEQNFPNHIFQAGQLRSSKFPAHLDPPITRKENYATRLAALALPTAPSNMKRHQTLQRFILVNDSVTIAVEVPVFLTREDIRYYRERGFKLGFDSHIITGHIDFLQVRNGHIHILDYKPEAQKERHAHVQLTIYALALARRTGLPLKDFKCAWFDEKDYFEFFPLKAVYKLTREPYAGPITAKVA
jgi:transposase-like protein